MVEMIPTKINTRWELLLPEHRAVRPEWPTWEQRRLASMHEHIRPGDLVYDIGAEEGDFPGLWSSWGASVVLFEPNPRVWPNIRAIFEANLFEDPIGCFVGFAGPEINTNQHLEGATGWHPKGEWPPCAYGPIIGDHGFLNLCERDDVPSTTIDTVAHMVGPPDVITIDVEGAELEVLKGASYVLERFKPLLWVSVHYTFMQEMYGQSHVQLWDLLNSFGYKVELLPDHHEDCWFCIPR